MCGQLVLFGSLSTPLVLSQHPAPLCSVPSSPVSTVDSGYFKVGFHVNQHREINTALIWMKCGPVSCVALRQVTPCLHFSLGDGVFRVPRGHPGTMWLALVLSAHLSLGFPWGCAFVALPQHLLPGCMELIPRQHMEPNHTGHDSPQCQSLPGFLHGARPSTSHFLYMGLAVHRNMLPHGARCDPRCLAPHTSG